MKFLTWLLIDYKLNERRRERGERERERERERVGSKRWRTCVSFQTFIVWFLMITCTSLLREAEVMERGEKGGQGKMCAFS